MVSSSREAASGVVSTAGSTAGESMTHNTQAPHNNQGTTSHHHHPSYTNENPHYHGNRVRASPPTTYGGAPPPNSSNFRASPPPPYHHPGTTGNITYGASPPSAYPPAAAVLTPSPMYHKQQQQQPYRFETPSYVFGVVATELQKAAGCTCKKSRCLKLYCQCFASSTTCGPKCKCGDCHNSTEHAESIDKARTDILHRNPAAFGPKKNIAYQPPPGFASASAHYPPGGWMRRPSPPASPPKKHIFQSSPPPMTNGSNPAVAVAKESTASVEEGPNNNKYYKGGGCKCRRSFCLKKYCECYQNSNPCGLSCKCTNCKNEVPVGYYKPDGPARPGYQENPWVCDRPEPEDQRRGMPTPAAAVAAYHTPSQHRHSVPNDARYGMAASSYQQQQQESANESLWERTKEEPTDRMAMMAAVAMTELFNGLPPKARHEAADDNNTSKREGAASTTPTAELTASMAASGIDKATTAAYVAVSDARKRQAPATEGILPLKKRKSPTSPGSFEDEEVSHVVSSSTSFMSVESRNPSPVSTYRPYGRYPLPNRFPWSSAAAPPPPSYGQHAPYHYDRSTYPQPSPTSMRASPPSAYQASPTRHLSPPNQRTAPSPLTVPRRDGGKSYEELTRTSGLPKSLSFRKICSRCGKTRGEHGELGFGNKCVYSECGKCGAGYHWHDMAGQSMGILCQLTVQQGALPGAALSYDRKICELAARADLQRVLQRRKQEHAATMESRAATILTTSKHVPATTSNTVAMRATVQ